MSEITTIHRGKRVVKEQLSQVGGFPVYQNCITPMGYHSESNCKANTTIAIGAGAAGDIAFVNCDFWAADDCFYFICSSNVMSKFIYFYLQSKKSFLKTQVRKASIPRLSRKVFDKMVIPVPSIEEQERIVSILDKFEALISDLSHGLPAEIEAVRQQYEYYRNKLLTFKAA